MKYKPGDKVRIKSLDWYNENKDNTGRVMCDYIGFCKEMTKYCGEVLTIMTRLTSLLRHLSYTVANGDSTQLLKLQKLKLKIY